MRVRTILLLTLPFVAFACGSSQVASDASPSDASTQASDASSPTDSSSNDSAAVDPLSEQGLWNRVNGRACDAVQFTSDSGAVAIADAAAYFLGTFKKGADGKWTGREYLLQYATPDWQKNNGKDCRVVWEATVTEGPISTCTTCEKAFTVKATVNPSETTCDAEFYKGEDTYTVTYEVDVAADGASEFFFSKSKKSLGTGYVKGDSIGYLSTQQCRYF